MVIGKLIVIAGKKREIKEKDANNNEERHVNWPSAAGERDGGAQ